MPVSISKPPNATNQVKHIVNVFLAGSIEMGAAENWQQRIESLLDTSEIHINLFNPRRDNWDSSWEQSKENEQFFNQVMWELEELNKADYVFFYFDPNTKSPITLLELGLMLSSKEPSNIVVVCPDGFYRKGNVDITCAYKEVLVYKSLEEGAVTLLHRIKKELL